MFRKLQEWIYKRRRRTFETWRSKIIKLLLEEILPENAPYQYDTVLSFLQVEGFDPIRPIRLDLLLPDYPLAIDFVGPQHNPSYGIASHYISKAEWEKLQQEAAIKQQMFASYGCPYMTLPSDEATDARSISEKIKAVIGHYLE